METVDESYRNTSTTDTQLYFSLFDDQFAVFVDQNLSLANATFGLNDTYFIYGTTYYPSGYSLPAIFIASAFAIILMIFVVVGNLLVIVAIVTEKSLKNIQNWFIASLAVADFFLGVLIIPFSLANELMGYWIFGTLWCDIHSAMDVLLCTASIMNLCLISLDRYWSITQAVDYLKKRTPLRAAIMITFVWIMSAVICIPPLLGWKVRRQPEQFPKCELASLFVLIATTSAHFCCGYHSANEGYSVLPASVGPAGLPPPIIRPTRPAPTTPSPPSLLPLPAGAPPAILPPPAIASPALFPPPVAAPPGIFPLPAAASPAVLPLPAATPPAYPFPAPVSPVLPFPATLPSAFPLPAPAPPFLPLPAPASPVLPAPPVASPSVPLPVVRPFLPAVAAPPLFPVPAPFPRPLLPTPALYPLFPTPAVHSIPAASPVLPLAPKLLRFAPPSVPPHAFSVNIVTRALTPPAPVLLPPHSGPK